MKHAAMLAARAFGLTLVAAPTTYAQQSQQPTAGAAAFAPTDIVGVKLGMTVDEARSALNAPGAPKLGQYSEYYSSLAYRNPVSQKVENIAAGRFLNKVAAIKIGIPVNMGNGGQARESEFLGIMFTPAPGSEQVVQINHTVRHAPQNAIREVDLVKALESKYGPIPAGAIRSEDQVIEQYLRSPNLTVGYDVAAMRYTIGLADDGRPSAIDPNCNVTPFIPIQESAASEVNLVISQSSGLQTALRCGPAATVHVEWGLYDPRATKDQRRVSFYVVAANAPQLALQSGMAASKLARDATTAATQNAADKATAQAPPKL